MDYHDIAAFSRSFGLVYLMVLFIGACAYALWPRNQDTFDRAARLPLEED